MINALQNMGILFFVLLHEPKVGVLRHRKRRKDNVTMTSRYQQNRIHILKAAEYLGLNLYFIITTKGFKRKLYYTVNKC